MGLRYIKSMWRRNRINKAQSRRAKLLAHTPVVPGYIIRVDTFDLGMQVGVSASALRPLDDIQVRTAVHAFIDGIPWRSRPLSTDDLDTMALKAATHLHEVHGTPLPMVFRRPK